MPLIDKSKPWEVNRNSWHFKLYEFAREAPRTKNFCNYFWMVMLKLGLVLLFVGMVLYLVVGYIILWFTQPVVAAIVTGVVLGGIGLLVLWVKRLEANQNKQPGIIAQKIHTVKEKYCPGIKYVD